ncbi:hypothetical protein SCA6_020400 [Theobroma cacao]
MGDRVLMSCWGLLGAGAGWHVTGVLLGTTYDDDEESQKLALSESTGLDRKQINIWFINQRKRHWKPSEDMQFVVIDATYPHYYMDNVLSNPFPTERSPHISLKTEPWIHRRRPDKLEGQLHLICKLQAKPNNDPGFESP